ncbi:MAG: protease complex subunit PrcB family protein [Rhodospirillales bacterium]|nr:protease complex subunit PrcB family protein [Rhodospirillales bacterium]
MTLIRFVPHLVAPLIAMALLAITSTIPPAAATPADTQTILLPTIMFQGSLPGPGRPGVFVMRNADDWRTFLSAARLTPTQMPDFTQNIAVAALLGTRATDGYTADIAQVMDRDWYLEVTVAEIPPAATSAVAQTLTNPYFIATLPKTEAPVVFSQGQFGTLQAPYNEFERLIRFTSELHYERTADQRRLQRAEQRIRELEALIARLQQTLPPDAIRPTH